MARHRSRTCWACGAQVDDAEVANRLGRYAEIGFLGVAVCADCGTKFDETKPHLPKIDYRPAWVRAIDQRIRR